MSKLLMLGFASKHNENDSYRREVLPHEQFSTTVTVACASFPFLESPAATHATPTHLTASRHDGPTGEEQVGQ